MADTLKAWLRTRLGVMIDLTPEMFGHYTRDGTLLAHILHSYDIISSSQLSTILRTHDPALCRVNLRTLRIWLQLINVTLSDECINEISKGKGAAALQLYYKVYLSLEGKDRLHFIALQKERKYMPSRFDISKVSEEPPPYHPPEHPLSHPLIEAADTVLWHKSKFWAITQACKLERQRFEALMKYPEVIEPHEHFILKESAVKKKTASEILDEFACKHPPPKMKKRYRVLECCPEKKLLDIPSVENLATAAEYTNLLKKRSEKVAKSHAFKMKIQTTMMTEAWEGLLRKQDRSFDEALGRRVLDQSRYEKQMMRKLCEVRDLRNRIVENRSIVDAMLLKARENELRLKEDHHREIMKEEIEDVKMEDCRMRELRRRMREEKMRRIREKHQSICLEIMEDLADIAVKVADYRQAKNNHIPDFIWNECKTSFLRNQPIFELMDNHFDNVAQIEDVEEIENKEETNNKKIMENEIKMRNGEKIRSKDEIEVKKKLKSEELVQQELERQRSLTDTDFESYRDLSSPWDQFVSKEEKKDEEVVRLGCIVLGYVVHRLLEILYPYSNGTASCAVRRVKVAAIISGIINPTLHEQLRELLKNNGIRLLKMEDAINHCLERYKQEMADVEYIDLNIVSTTIRDIKKIQTKNKIDNSKGRQKKIERTPKMATLQKNSADEKQTQTPRQIPYDDMHPVLSDTAYIGKWTYEFLTLGEPISDELNTKILIEYLRGIEDDEGWALINYPNTYKQMAMLEKALTGREIPPDPKIINFADVSIEEIDLPSARIVFEGDEDAIAIYRQSRLLPNPISKVKDSSSTTFMTIYIKAMLKSKTIGRQDLPCTSLPDDATSIDEYYANENIAYGFFYNVLDYSSLKQMAEFMAVQTPKKQLEEKISQAYHDKQKFPETVVIKCLIPKSKWETYLSKWDTYKYEEKKDIEAENNDLQPEVQTQLANSHIRPGEDDWQWINFIQPPDLLEILATFWESVEDAYVENLKKILSLRRMHKSAVMPYKNLILRNLTKFVERPDKRQVLLQDFQRAFNEIDEDLRDDSDMKCELHCRVDDFRMELWNLCDARRHEAEEERKRTLQSEWIPVETVVLINVYIEILQAEIDRFIDTMQLLQDYYTSMSQKPLQEPRFCKIVLEHVALANIVEKTSLFEDKEQELSKIESIDASARRAINMDQFKTEIETLLIDISKSFDPDQSIIYNIIKDNIQQVRNVVNSISSMILEMLQKEGKAAIPKTDIKNKIIKNASPDSTFDKLARRNRDLIEEWRYAALFEIDRINQRLDVLGTAARFNLIFLLDTMKEAFHGIYHHIIERYKRELESINEMANVFCFAIEEERPIQQQLLLDGDQFVVRPDVLMFEDPKRFAIPIEEAPSPLRFRIVQLGRLIDIFRRIAPHGIISERALIYILQDVVSCGEEDCYPSFVPCAWQQLHPSDIEKLIEGLFGATEYIEWREFVVYAMDLPMPSHQDILKARMAFRMQDPNLRETITRDQFQSTPLWFLEISTLHEKLSDEEDDYNEIMNIMLREEVRLGKCISNGKSNFIETSEDNSRAILRLTLAKELICRMYLVNRNTVHYTAMLLAFCKDKDPREGLGKAFTLAMGARVCTDAVEGEKYVDELIEKKRRDKELQLSEEYLHEQANEIVREIINHIMNRMAKAVDVLEKIYDRDLAPKRMMIQQLNEHLAEIDPAELLPPEEIAEYLVIEDFSVNDKQECEPYFVSVSPAAETFEDYDIIRGDEKVIFWLPRNVCLTVLSTCLPWLAQQPNLFDTFTSLRKEIDRLYDELRDEELNDDKDLVLSHRLLNHNFIHELLCATSKFVSKNMTDSLRNILKDRYKTI